MRKGWRTDVPMGTLCSIDSGSSNVQDAVDDAPYALFDRSKKIKRSTRYLFDCEALIIPGEGTEFLPRHFVGKFDLHQRAYALHSFSNEMDVKYLYYYLIYVKDYFPRVAVGATVKSLRRRHFEKLPVTLAPRDEQQRIVAILDEVFGGLDTAIAHTDKNLKNARKLFETALIVDIFGDADKQGWPSTTVATLALPQKGSIRTGPFGSQLLHGEFVDEGIAVLGIDNAVANEFRWGKKRFITPAKFAQLSRYQVRPGDVLITIMGTCGRCAIVPDDIPTAINTKHLCCISLDRSRCLPKYLHAYFLYHPVARTFLAAQAKGSIMDGLNMGIIERLPVRLPSIAKQKSIIQSMDALFEKTRRLEAIYRKRLDTVGELKQSILQKAFSGELTLPPSQAIKEAAE